MQLNSTLQMLSLFFSLEIDEQKGKLQQFKRFISIDMCVPDFNLFELFDDKQSRNQNGNMDVITSI